MCYAGKSSRAVSTRPDLRERSYGSRLDGNGFRRVSPVILTGWPGRDPAESESAKIEKMETDEQKPFVFRGIEIKDDRISYRTRDESALDDPPPTLARPSAVHRTTRVTCVETEATDPD